jgi:hypothetical protein
MFVVGKISDQQKHGVIICLPKMASPTRTEDYSPIALMNADYKLMARIIANRLRPLLSDLLQPNQHCGVPGNTVFEAVKAVREAITYAEVTRAPLCMLSLDFQESFDNTSHTHLFTMLKNCGFSELFIDRMKRMYEKATSPIQTNGHMSGPVPIRCSVRQGCPLSMQLFALCLNPLLHILEKKIPRHSGWAASQQNHSRSLCRLCHHFCNNPGRHTDN